MEKQKRQKKCLLYLLWSAVIRQRWKPRKIQCLERFSAVSAVKILKYKYVEFNTKIRVKRDIRIYTRAKGSNGRALSVEYGVKKC